MRIAFNRPKGAAFVPPPQISRLPMSLLRTALVTRQPEQTAQGVVEYQRRMEVGEDYEPPMMLPQRTMFQQWKSDLQTDGANRPEHKDPLRSAMSIAMMAKASGVPGSTVHRVEGPPVTYEMARAARDRGSEILSEPTDHEPPYVVTRDVPAYGRPLEPPPEVFVRAAEITGERVAVDRANNFQRAMISAARASARLRNIVTGPGSR